MSAKPKILADVQVGDAIWSGGMRWIVTERLATRFRAERPGQFSPIRETWSYSGAPCSAPRPAEPETPAKRHAWQTQQASEEARRKAVAECREARAIIKGATDDLLFHLGSAHPEGDRIAKARALADFVAQLIKQEVQR